jgi:hypothetical protein
MLDEPGLIHAWSARLLHVRRTPELSGQGRGSVSERESQRGLGPLQFLVELSRYAAEA